MLRNMSVISSCVVRSVQIKVGFMNIVKGYHHTVFLMLWWSSCWVCGVVRLYLCLQPRVMLGSSTPGCWQPQDQTCPRLSRHSRLSTIFMVQHSSSQTFQTLSLEMNQPTASSSAVFVLTLCFRVRWGGEAGIDYQWARNLVSNKSCDLQCHSRAGVIQLKVNKLTYNGIIDMFIILTDLGRWPGWSLTRHRLYRFYLHIDCVSVYQRSLYHNDYCPTLQIFWSWKIS